ncbi:hypothetical protein [Sphingomonas radiodurans]|uniref:hypothetical protein n=1 Tax=Sphingomonas radiodurans TaxID=2890321 RepID=UPI001E4F5C38|nr:hypothetical protein [Sphingomonas radiodurans]WBH16611.1 hypothetical protein LLW23_00295 [Sphingomonas radiodurans]
MKIDESDTHLLAAMAAAVRGEEVMLDSSTGTRVRLVGTTPANDAERERRAAKRRAAIGMFKHLVGDRDIDVGSLKMYDFWEERDRRKFGDIG